MDKKNGALLSVCSNSILIVFKLIAGLSMGSISVISEAIHSSIDLLASVIAFFSIRTASKKEDEDHNFGHGKYENLSGFIEAILIFVAAAIIFYEAGKKLIEGSTIENAVPGIIVMLISATVNLVISLSLLKIAKKTDSIALEADAMHLLTDVFTSLGVFVGLVLVKITGLKIIDPIAAIFVAALIVKTSIDLTLKSIEDLVDHRLPKEDLDRVQYILKSHPEVIDFHKLRSRKSGGRRELDLHLLMESDTTLVTAEYLCDCIEDEIKLVFPDTYITIHTEPESHHN